MDFFQFAYNREQYLLDIKILALRGLAQFITEDEITKLMKEFNETLEKKSSSKNPNYYEEFELLKRRNALPYLLRKYKYKCFNTSLEIMSKNYNSAGRKDNSCSISLISRGRW